MNKPRCQIIFEQSIRSDQTRRNYLLQIEKFKRFTGTKNIEDLLQWSQKEIQEKIEDYVISLKNNTNPNSFAPQMSPIFLFYELNDVTLNKTKIKKMYPARIKAQGFNAYTRDDISFMLSNTRKKRTKAMILVFASTGCRVGALQGLKMSDISDTINPNCKCLQFYAGFPEEYYGFLTPEATKALYEYFEERTSYGEKLSSDSPVFALYENASKQIEMNAKIQPVTRFAVSNAIATILSKNGRPMDSGQRHKIAITHGFRKLFNKILKMRNDSNLSVYEKFLGHSVTISLDNAYLPLGKEELFSEFEKAIPELTIREDERYSLRIGELEKERRREEDKAVQNKQLQEELTILKLRIERMELSREK